MNSSDSPLLRHLLTSWRSVNILTLLPNEYFVLSDKLIFTSLAQSGRAENLEKYQYLFTITNWFSPEQVKFGSHSSRWTNRGKFLGYSLVLLNVVVFTLHIRVRHNMWRSATERVYHSMAAKPFWSTYLYKWSIHFYFTHVFAGCPGFKTNEDCLLACFAACLPASDSVTWQPSLFDAHTCTSTYNSA